MLNEFRYKLQIQLEYLAANEGLADFLTVCIVIFGILIIGHIIGRLVRKVVITVLDKVARRSATKWDDYMIKHRVFSGIAHLIPFALLESLIPYFFVEDDKWVGIFLRINHAIFVLITIIIINRVLNTIQSILSDMELFKSKPLKSFFQLAKIVLGGLLIVLMISIIADKSIMYFFGAFGAISAVLILVFKDTILGFIASIQLSANDMIRVGDWVDMPKYGADGDVVEINLTTVKVRNWDKTITTVPTYSFISDSFKNWRGMQETGARRISRSIYINQHSVQFANKEMIERFMKMHLLKDFIPEKEKEIENYNRERGIDISMVSNGRRMTNLGVFREYLSLYLKNNSRINQDMFIMVRQLEPSENGIPLQIYCFANTIAWAEYELIQADIFDHTLAVIHQFDLSIFQNPSGSDFRNLMGKV